MGRFKDKPWGGVATIEPTERQWEIIRWAFHRGYWNHPRGVTLTAIAERFGVSKPAMQESLIGAEYKVMKLYVEKRESLPK